MLIRSRCRFFVLLCVVSACAFAQAKSDLSSILRVTRIATAPDGAESHQSADSARPGDVLEYVAEYRNDSSHLIRQLAATIPIPDGTEYVLPAQPPAGLLASIDGSRFAPVPLTRKVISTEGRLVDEPVPTREYRFLRWPGQDLPAGRTLQVQARVKLSNEPPSPRAAAR